MLPLLTMEAPAPPQSSGKQQQQHQLMRTVSISVLVISLPVLYVSFLHVPPAALFRDTTFWFLMSNSIIIVIAADSGMLFFGSSSSASRSPSPYDDGGVPFVVSGGAEAVAVKSGHASMGVVVTASGEVVVQNQAALVVMEHGGMPVVAENDDAYALVGREDQGEQVVASTTASRELIISPYGAAGEVAAVKSVVDVGAIVPAARPRRLTASRSLAAREERPARTRRHGHRPSHSHALVPVQDKSVVVSEEKHLRRAATDRRPSPAAAAVEEDSEYSRLSDEELNRRVEEFITKFNREIRLQVEKEQAAAA